MLQAITVKYLPATNTKPARLKAIASAGTMTQSRDHGLDTDKQARALVEEFCRAYDWQGYEIHGGVLNTSDFVFVLARK